MTDNADNKPVILSRRLLSKSIHKLGIKDGDVLAVRVGSTLAKQEIIDGLREAFGKYGFTHSIVIVVDDFGDLSALNEQEMNKHGWFKAPTLRRLIHVPKDGEKEKAQDDKEKILSD